MKHFILFVFALVLVSTSSQAAPGAISDIYIDIVDSRVVKDGIQIIIHNGSCTDRINFNKTDLNDRDKLNKEVEKVMKLRQDTGKC